MNSEGSTTRRQWSPESREQIEAQVLAAIRSGLSFEKACRACEVPESTVRGWRDRDPEFAERVRDAIAQRELLWLAELRRGGTQWTRYAWLLERTNPTDWGRRDWPLDEVMSHVTSRAMGVRNARDVRCVVINIVISQPQLVKRLVQPLIDMCSNSKEQQTNDSQFELWQTERDDGHVR